MRIEITGAIGAGKTSLAKLLLEHGYNVVFEEFKLNPFWKAFYSNPDKYNFETEITFILQHYHDLKRKCEETNDTVCDFSFIQDLAYAEMGLKQSQITIFRSVFNYIIEELGEPTLVISMQCSVAGLLERIRLRGRQEEVLINADFLDGLTKFIKKEITNRKHADKRISFLEIDTEKINIISSFEDQQSTLQKIVHLI